MIIDWHEMYDLTPTWFEKQVRDALAITDASVIEKLVLPRLCELLAAYRVRDAVGGEEAANRMKSLIDSNLIDQAME